MEIYSRYKVPKVSGLKCSEHSLTEQVYKDQCDLNFLIRKYGLEEDPFQLTLYIDPATRKMQYVDTTNVPDLYAALSAQRHLRQIFNELSYTDQQRFSFSVDAFSDYLMVASEDDIKKLGLKNIVFQEQPKSVSEAAPAVAPESKESQAE